MADLDAFMDSDVMKGHFEAAGITDDPGTTTTTTAQNTTADTTAATTTTDTTTTPASPGDKSAAATEGTPASATTTQPNADGSTTKPTATTVDSKGNGTDGTAKPGKEGEAPKSGSPRDLTLADGSVVKGGQERRWYETAQVARQQVAAVTERLTAAEQRATVAEAAVETHKQALQMTGSSDPTVVTNAMRLMRDLASSPVETVTKLLAELKERGHTIEGIGGAVDTLAIRNMLSRQQQGEGRQQQGLTPDQAAESARVETGQFFAKYPDAVLHDDVLADIITKHPGVSLEAAYFQLRQAAIDQGFDWSQALKPQVQARATKTPVAAPAATTPAAPLVNGRGADSGNINPLASTVDPAGETYDDIIRAAMQENGVAQRRN